MAGVKMLRKIQMGKESTAGTAVAATTVWGGLGMLQDRRELKYVPENIGHLLPSGRAYYPKYQAGITFEQVEATFEQLPHLLAAGIKNVVTGSADGAGSGKIYSYDISDASENTIKTYTIEGGDNQQAERMEYAFLTALRLSGKAGEAVMMAGDWVGRQAAKVSFTAGQTRPVVEEILFQKGKIYIDDASGTLGTTQKTNTFLEFSLDLKTGYVPVWTGDGNLYFSFTKNTGPTGQLKVIFEHDTVGVDQKDAWRAITAKQIRMTFEGSTLGSAGTTYSKKTLRMDFSGLWGQFNKLDDRDGNDILEGTFDIRYVSGAGVTGAQFLVVNELASLA